MLCDHIIGDAVTVSGKDILVLLLCMKYIKFQWN